MMKDYYQTTTKLSSLPDKSISGLLAVGAFSFLATCSPADAEKISEPEGGSMPYYKNQQDLSGYTDFSLFADDGQTRTYEDTASSEIDAEEVVGSFISRLTSNIREPLDDVHKEIVSRPWDFV